MLVVARGVMHMVRRRGGGSTAIERRRRVERRMGHVPREMAGQPSVEGNGENAEPHAEPMSPERSHEHPAG